MTNPSFPRIAPNGNFVAHILFSPKPAEQLKPSDISTWLADWMDDVAEKQWREGMSFRYADYFDGAPRVQIENGGIVFTFVGIRYGYHCRDWFASLAISFTRRWPNWRLVRSWSD